MSSIIFFQSTRVHPTKMNEADDYGSLDLFSLSFDSRGRLRACSSSICSSGDHSE